MTAGTRIRAGLVRFLALGGDDGHPVHERGIQLVGAWIDGDLELRNCDLTAPLQLQACRLGLVDLGWARLPLLSLRGSRLAGDLRANGAEIRGGVFLNDGFHARGEVRLLGASIGGSLTCRGGRFESPGGVVLGADGARIGGSVFLDKGFHARGEVRLIGASIDCSLECSGGRFENPKGRAFLCQAAQVRGALVWRDVARVQGQLDLTALKVANLVDNAASWETADGGLILDGFQYDRFAGEASTDAAMRIAWLKRQVPTHLGEAFRPQPWEHCAKVLREMGHADAARAVLIEKEALERAAGRHGGRWSLRRALHGFYGKSIGYGYRPGPLVAATLLVHALSTAVFWLKANPSRQWWSAPAYLIQPTAAATQLPCPAGDGCGPEVPAYDTFLAPAHALEVMMPISNLRRPPEWKLRLQDERGEWLTGGRALMAWTWFLTLYGWLAGILLVLWVGKLIRKE